RTARQGSGPDQPFRRSIWRVRHRLLVGRSEQGGERAQARTRLHLQRGKTLSPSWVLRLHSKRYKLLGSHPHVSIAIVHRQLPGSMRAGRRRGKKMIYPTTSLSLCNCVIPLAAAWLVSNPLCAQPTADQSRQPPAFAFGSMVGAVQALASEASAAPLAQGG